MPAHPTLSQNDARQMVSWILSLAGGGEKQKSLPAKGTVKPTLDKKPTESGVLVLSASYTDKGGAGIKPMTGNASVALRSSMVSVSSARNLNKFAIQSFGGMQFFMVPKEEASFSLDSIDLTGISGVELMLTSNSSPKYGYVFEFRLDGLNGRKIGEGTLPAGAKFTAGQGGYGRTSITANLEPVTDGKHHNLYVVSKALNAGEEGSLILTFLQFKSKPQAGPNLVARKKITSGKKYIPLTGIIENLIALLSDSDEKR